MAGTSMTTQYYPSNVQGNDTDWRNTSPARQKYANDAAAYYNRQAPVQVNGANMDEKAKAEAIAQAVMAQQMKNAMMKQFANGTAETLSEMGNGVYGYAPKMGEAEEVQPEPSLSDRLYQMFAAAKGLMADRYFGTPQTYTATPFVREQDLVPNVVTPDDLYRHQVDMERRRNS